MIDERELTELLAEAADAYDVPADGPEHILAAAEDRRPRQLVPWWRRRRLVVAAAAFIVVIGSTAVIGAIRQSRDNTPKFNAVGHPVPGGSAGATAGGSQGVSDAGAMAGTAGVAESAGPGLPAPAPLRATTNAQVRPPGEPAKVVKTGSMQVEVKDGAVGPTMSRLTTLAAGVNGYVADTKTSDGGDQPSGSATLRVPANTFEDVLAQVRKMGTVQSVDVHGQDVTAQYSDIRARLTALNSTRDQLLTILRRATSIGDILAVQDRLNQVQTEIEQLQGQQKVLDDQTSYASLTVAVSEHGVKLGPPDKPSGLAKAWDDARHGFTSGLETILAGSGTALVLLLVLAALVFLGRWAWIVLRRRLV